MVCLIPGDRPVQTGGDPYLALAADRDHADSDGDGPAAEATYERSRETLP
jgi:hypothetical protein